MSCNCHDYDFSIEYSIFLNQADAKALFGRLCPRVKVPVCNGDLYVKLNKALAKNKIGVRYSLGRLVLKEFERYESIAESELISLIEQGKVVKERLCLEEREFSFFFD